MKKEKKTLAELKVSSFTTNTAMVNGGQPSPIGTGHCCSGTLAETACW